MGVGAPRAGGPAAARRGRGDPRRRASRAKSSLRAVLLCRRGSKPRPATLPGAPRAGGLRTEARQQSPQEAREETAFHTHRLVAPDQGAKQAEGEPCRASRRVVALLYAAQRAPVRATQRVAEAQLERPRHEHEPAIVLEVADLADGANHAGG